MATMTGTTEQKIAGIPAGKTFSNRLDSTFIHVRRLLGANGGYEIECGWTVPEAYDDDYDSCSYHPFKTSTPRPWVGRKTKVVDASSAAKTYDDWSVALNSHARPAGGEVIGSVQR